MFGFSLGKLLFTILIIVAVWKGFAFVSRLARERDARPARPRRRRGTNRQGATIELIECPRCGSYFDPDQGCSCARRPA